MNDFVIFETESQQVEVRLEGETLWVTQGYNLNEHRLAQHRLAQQRLAQQRLAELEQAVDLPGKTLIFGVRNPSAIIRTLGKNGAVIR